MNWDSVLGIVTMLRAGRPGSRVSILERDSSISLPTKCPDLHWHLHSLLFN